MMTDFKRSTEKQGWRIHFDKTKILTNQKSVKEKEIEFDKITVEILPPEGKAKHLEQMISFTNQEIFEIQQRIRCCAMYMPLSV